MQKYKMKKGNTQNVSIDQILPASLSSSKQFTAVESTGLRGED